MCLAQRKHFIHMVNEWKAGHCHVFLGTEAVVGDREVYGWGCTHQYLYLNFQGSRGLCKYSPMGRAQGCRGEAGHKEAVG